MFCPECGCDMVLSKEPITIDYRNENIAIEGIEHYACPECGEYAVSAEASKLLAEKARHLHAERHGLLPPSEIAAIRKRLGLTQTEFQELLGVTGVTVSRWENGKSQQTKTADKLMRMADAHACCARDLMQLAEVGPSGRVIDDSVCVYRRRQDRQIPRVRFAGDAE